MYSHFVMYMPVTSLWEQIKFPTERLRVNKQETTTKKWVQQVRIFNPHLYDC